ncbi:MAG: aspartate--tRNA ligase [bacterium]
MKALPEFDLSQTSMRSKYCGEIGDSDLGKDLTLVGWVNSNRQHGGINFVDLRDRSGLIQLVFAPEVYKDAGIKLETLIQVFGAVKLRPAEMVNPHLPTGKFEFEVQKFQVISQPEHLPFIPEDEVKASFELRLQYRYLDLRRPLMVKNLIIRSKVIQSIRNFLEQHKFLEIETPYLTSPTPEGARDYLVPSRIHPGKFYALAQSPQMYKQLLMVGGIDRYYQFARCFRDEDLRADRQPEHTQIDMEMSFVSQEDVLSLAENLMVHLFNDVLNVNLEIPFPRLSYNQAMIKYGTDKPDLRFDLEIVDITEQAQKSDMNILKNSECTRVLMVEDFLPSRKDITELENLIKLQGAGGLLWTKYSQHKYSGPFAKFITPEIIEIANPDKTEGTMFAVSGSTSTVAKCLGLLRTEVAKKENLYSKKWAFVWIVDFPLFELNDQGQLEPCHHIFTMPHSEDLHLLDTDPIKVRGQQYDIVLNGIELASGSIRNHLPQLQRKLFSIIGLTDQQIDQRFGFLLESFKYGAPPHGGIAPGLDRLVMQMADMKSITEVIAFPKTLQAAGLMEKCPRPVEQQLLNELNLELTKSEGLHGN